MTPPLLAGLREATVENHRRLDATAFLKGYGAAAFMSKQFIGFLWQVDSPAVQSQSIATAVDSFAKCETRLSKSGVLK